MGDDVARQPVQPTHREAILRAFVLAPGLAPLGVLFGALAVANGFPILATVLMSVLYMAGTAQFAAVGLAQDNAPVLAVVALVVVINARYFLLSVAGRHVLPTPLTPRRNRLLQGAMAVEETYAVQVAWARTGVPRWPHILSLGASVCTIWLLATLVGALLGQRLPDLAVLGLDYALPGLFVGLMGVFSDSRAKATVAVAAAIAGGMLALVGFGTAAAILLPPVLAIGLGRWFPARRV